MGQSAEVRIIVKSNPKPNDGTWIIGNSKVVKVGNNSEDRKFFSNIKNGTVENEYYIVLLFTMTSGEQFNNILTKYFSFFKLSPSTPSNNVILIIGSNHFLF